jgi:hydroxylamine reductase (hybrid-cluster protein)
MDRNLKTSMSMNTADGAIDLMAKLAVLIVAALLFACYGIREGHSQTLGEPSAQSSPKGRPDRVAMLRRGAADGRAAATGPAHRRSPPRAPL